MKKLAVALTLAVCVSMSAFAAGTLRVVNAGPVGEVASPAEANEIRAVFSEPMVVLGKIPQPVSAPFFKIDPAVKGSFRWSGTTTLIFTPEKQLPYATEVTVTIDKTAKAVSGATLDQQYSWSFVTPTIRLVNSDHYRKANGAVVIGLRFNQPVDPSIVLPHLAIRTQAHEIELPDYPESGADRITPAEMQAFEAKVAKARAAAASDGQTILAFQATEWDKERFTPGKDLLVLETKPGIAPDTWLTVTLDDKLAASPRNARGPAQSMEAQLDQTFFVTALDCYVECDPEQRNAVNFRSNIGVAFEKMQKAVTVVDITDAAKPVTLKAKPIKPDYDYPSWNYSLDELGYSPQPGHSYAVRVDPSLESADGQKLGYVFAATFENWDRSAFVSFGAGQGVWETSGGPVLPFHTRNFKTVRQWLAPLSIEQLMPTMVRLRDTVNAEPDVKPTTRTLKTARNKIAAIGLDLKPVIGDDNLGLAWAAVQAGDPMAHSKVYDANVLSTIVQATNLGISVKDSPQNTIVMVTRLDDAKPVAGANVSIRNRDNKTVWTGVTDANGLAVANDTEWRRGPNAENPYEDSWVAMSDLHFVVIAEKDGDVAYVGNDWNEGLAPWEFDLRFDLSEAEPQLRGTIFADRGVYKLGEEIHFKLIARADTPKGMQLVPPGTKFDVIIRDSQGKDIDTRTVEANAWSSAEWTFRVPTDSPLGSYTAQATTAKRGGTIAHQFLVAAYRRPEFRVDATLTGTSALAGTKLNGRINARYLFGAPMAGRPVNTTYKKQELTDVPQTITDRWPEDQYLFLGRDWSDEWPSQQIIEQKDGVVDAKGFLDLKLETDKDAGAPYEYQIEGTVTDVTRQQLSGRASIRVEGTPWYIGVKRPPYFADTAAGIDTAIVAAGLDGLAVAGVNVKVELKRLQWVSARQAEGDGFYGWESERKEVAAGEWTIQTKTEPVALKVPLTEGGEYLLIASAEDGQGRTTRTRTWFYAVGDGYTAWERYDHNRIDLIPEKKIYRPGDTARIMVKSPWEKATALLTTEREGVRTWKTFELTSTQQTITVPISDNDIPNVYVSVLLVKGRTLKDPGKDGSDPGKPAFRLGYVELEVEDSSKRLTVDVKANRDEFRPASKAKIDIDVKDAKGKPSQSEVTLWAVDYGVLSLTAYETPDVLDTIYLQKALQVLTEDSRQRIISRRVMTPKGAADGGGGGRDPGAGTLRKDFRVLAFWVGSLVTDAKGHATKEITLPESLTTYRIMAVAGDKQSRFGWDNAEVRVNKPLMLTPSWPRFLAVGDKAYFGGVVHNQTKGSGKATVTIESLDPNILSFAGGSQTVTIDGTNPAEVRFDAVANAIGDARVRMRVQMGRENDAFEDVIPVRILVSPETVAAYGEAKPKATETLEIPAGVVPNYGGMRIEMASTAMVGLAEGVRYLVEYPYGCAEQRSSRTLAMVLGTDLGTTFNLPGVEAGKQKAAIQSSLNELSQFQCYDGGFSFWAGDCNSTSPYLTSYVLHVIQRSKAEGYTVDAGMLDRGYSYLETRLAEPPPSEEGWRPAYNAWQAFSIKVLAEGGKNADSHLERVYGYRDRMPVFALAYLLDALQAKGEKSGPRATELHRRLLNSISPEGGFAFVNELRDPYLLWLWSSNVRSTAIVLDTLVRGGQDEEIVKRMVRWLVQARKGGRWNDTQENAWALMALVDFYRKYEAETPDFVGTLSAGTETLATETFKGRSTSAKTQQLSMQQVLAKAPAGQQIPLVFTREGAGTLYYMLRLRYASNVVQHEPLDQGFHIERLYAVRNGGAPSTAFKAGDLIEVTLRIRNTKERRFVAVTDPIPAGTEPVEAWFATTASELVEQQAQYGGSWAWWLRGGFDHVERHDDRVDLFATRLSEGDHEFKYLVRATTSGTFITAPTHAEEMYEPEVFGRTATSIIEVGK